MEEGGAHEAWPFTDDRGQYLGGGEGSFCKSPMLQPPTHVYTETTVKPSGSRGDKTLKEEGT